MQEVSTLKEHCPSLSDVQCLANCFLIYSIQFFNCLGCLMQKDKPSFYLLYLDCIQMYQVLLLCPFYRQNKSSYGLISLRPNIANEQQTQCQKYVRIKKEISAYYEQISKSQSILPCAHSTPVHTWNISVALSISYQLLRFLHLRIQMQTTCLNPDSIS